MLAILDCLKNFKLPKESKCIIFFYRLIIKGYKKALEETDISDLHPRDKNDVVIPEFEKAWKACVLYSREAVNINCIGFGLI
jgi:hypothetical protein